MKGLAKHFYDDIPEGYHIIKSSVAMRVLYNRETKDHIKQQYKKPRIGSVKKWIKIK